MSVPRVEIVLEMCKMRKFEKLSSRSFNNELRANHVQATYGIGGREMTYDAISGAVG